MPDILSLRQAAEHFGIDPTILVKLFYHGKLDNKQCPNLGRCRAIPRSYLPQMEKVLRETGKLPQPMRAGAAESK